MTRSPTPSNWSTPRGELDYAVDALSRTTDYTYDAAGRLTAIDYPSGTTDVTYQYNRAGSVITMTDGLGTISYTYDQLHHTRWMHHHLPLQRDQSAGADRLLGLGSVENDYDAASHRLRPRGSRACRGAE